MPDEPSHDLFDLPPVSARDRWLDTIAGLRSDPASAVALVVVVIVAVSLLFIMAKGSAEPPELVVPMEVPDSVAPTTTALGVVVAHAAGSVRVPGLYELAPGSRVADLLDAAGGATSEADLDRVNLAAPLPDGSRVFVPAVGEAEPAVVGGGEATPTDGPIDLNTAAPAQLETLPGVGPATAAAIVEHRERTGPFRSVDDLLEVRGIGPAKLDQLRPHVAV